MAPSSAALGIPVPWEFRGRTYEVHPRDLEMECRFTVWLESRALDAIRRHSPQPGQAEGTGILTYGEYLQQMEGWRQECAAGVYDYGRAVALLALSDPLGPAYKHLAWLSLSRGDERITPDLVEQAWKEPAARDQLLLAMARANTDPNRRTPEGQTTPATPTSPAPSAPSAAPAPGSPGSTPSSSPAGSPS